MITRRKLLSDTCCIANVALSGNLIGSCLADVLHSNFICSTIDTVTSGNTDFEIVPFGVLDNNKEFSIDTTRKSFDLTNYGTAALKDRWLGSDGLTPRTGILTLGINFLDGSSSQQAIFRDAANAWVKNLNGKLALDYSVPQGKTQIRVTFNTSVNESHIGRNCLLVKTSSPTMWIADVVPYVIQHECGHALGLQHEHQNPNAPFQWNAEKVISDMKARGWSREQTISNIIDRYSQNLACVGDPDFNEKSIMLYPIPAAWTNNTFTSNENRLISSRDVKCASALFDRM